jgi:hypothetical protein
LAKAYWIDLGREAVQGKGAIVYAFIMANRFGWKYAREKTEKEEPPKAEEKKQEAQALNLESFRLVK